MSLNPQNVATLQKVTSGNQKASSRMIRYPLYNDSFWNLPKISLLQDLIATPMSIIVLRFTRTTGECT